MPIPDFEDGVNLPAGLHFCTWEELVSRFCNGGRRQQLCAQMQRLFQRATDCGFLHVIVGGSFPTAKQEPGDFDVSWIVRQDFDKGAISPECLELVESDKSPERFQCDVFCFPIAGDGERIQYWGTQLGYDYKSMTPRGTLLLDL